MSGHSQEVPQGLFAGIRPASGLIPLLLGLSLGACAPAVTPPGEVPSGAEPGTGPGAAIDGDPAHAGIPDRPGTEDSELTPELLYDVLVAAVANQRNRPELALDALVRAVYLSRNRHLAVNAIQLALRLGENQQAIDLSRLLLARDPDNTSAVFTLATAQIRNELAEDAADTLLDLVDNQDTDGDAVLQEVAGIIARQKEPARTYLRDRLDRAVDEGNVMAIFTAALVAARLEESEQHRSLLELVLSRMPEWETAAIFKLAHIADNEREQLDSWAEEFLETSPSAERFRIQYGHLLILDERLEDSLYQFSTVLESNPESADALFAAAVVNMEREDYETAEPLFRRYLAGNGNADQARIYLAEMLIDQERYGDASPLLRQVQSSRHYLEAQIMLSGVIARQSNVEAGLSHLRGIDANGEEESVRLILEQDLLLREFSLMERSMALLTEALVERPEHPSLLYSRGLLAAQLNRIDVMERDMRLLIELQPDNAHAYNALGYTLADQTDRLDEALALITRALELLPEDPYILDSMGWVQYRIGDIDRALEYLVQAWDYKKDAEIAAHLGEVLWVLGRRAEAEDIWAQGKETGPDNTTLLKTIDRFLDDDPDRHAVYTRGASRHLTLKPAVNA